MYRLSGIRCSSFCAARSALRLLLAPLFLGAACSRSPEETAAPPEDEGMGHLAVQARYAADGEAADDVRYTVQSVDDELKIGPGRRNTFELFSGRYRVTASLDVVEKTEEATVRADALTELQIVLDAGVLDAKAVLAEDGPAAPDPRYQALAMERDIHGDRVSVAGPGRRSAFTLPAGTYIVRVEDDQAGTEAQIEVRAGERTEATLVLDAGLLRAQALADDGSQVSDQVRWTVTSVTEGVPDDEPVVGPARRSEFLLPAGAYVVQASAGARDARASIEIQAGEQVDVKITLPDAEDSDAGTK